MTCNRRDFAPILREWAESGRRHAGCILIGSLDHHQFSKVVAGVEHLLEQRPRQDEGQELSVAL